MLKGVQITYSFNPYLTGGIGAAPGEPLPVAPLLLPAPVCLAVPVCGH